MCAANAPFLNEDCNVEVDQFLVILWIGQHTSGSPASSSESPTLSCSSSSSSSSSQREARGASALSALSLSRTSCSSPEPEDSSSSDSGAGALRLSVASRSRRALFAGMLCVGRKRRGGGMYRSQSFLFCTMRHKRAKAYRKLMSLYAMTYGFRQPYQVLGELPNTFTRSNGCDASTKASRCQHVH